MSSGKVMLYEASFFISNSTSTHRTRGTSVIVVESTCVARPCCRHVGFGTEVQRSLGSHMRSIYIFVPENIFVLENIFGLENNFVLENIFVLRNIIFVLRIVLVLTNILLYWTILICAKIKLNPFVHRYLYWNKYICIALVDHRI